MHTLDPSPFAFLSGILSGLWWAGVTILSLLVTLLVAWLAPNLARRAGNALTQDLGGTLLATAALWLGLPAAAFLLLFTVVGIPVSLAIGLVLMPILWLVGFAVAAIRVGEELTLRLAAASGHHSPFLYTVLGVLALRLVGLMPVVGSAVLIGAGLFGAGAVVSRLWSERQTSRALSLPPANTTPFSLP